MSNYLSAKLEGRVLPNGMRGVFAHQPVKAGELLIVWGGHIVTGDQLDELPEETRRLTIQVEEDLYMWSSEEEPSDWVNHSCEPNAWLDGQIVLIARRDIAVGEEVCFDYATSDASPYDEFDCLCGAATCRGRVTGNDWRNPELWSRYAGHFSPYVQRRIDQLRGDGLIL